MLVTLFSAEFAVSFRSTTSVRRHGYRHSAHTMSAMSSAVAANHFQRPETCKVGTLICLPRRSFSRSARNSAADW